MGAIATFLALHDTPTEDVVRTMCAAAPHRGSTVETAVRGRCAVACVALDDHRDVSLASSGEFSAVFVGILDNKSKLATALRLDGASATPSEADVLVHGVNVAGTGFVRQLRGVFAGAVTDGRRVFCFRDQVGYEPLFYRLDANGLYVATEPKQVVAGAGIPREPDVEVVRSIFFRVYDDHTPCAIRGVSRLPKATLATSDGSSLELERYWDPAVLLEQAPLPADEIPERFATLMDQAVRRCLTGEDVVLLSGGIDSPAVAAFGAPRHLELTGRPLPALTAIYPKYPSVDELVYVEPIAEALGLTLHTFEQSANPLADIDRWVSLADTPYPAASLAQYEESFLCARGLGYRTLLSGEHAELVFNMSAHLLGYLLSHGRVGAARDQLRSHRSRGASPIRLGSLLVRSVAPAWILAARRRRNDAFVPDWVEAEAPNEHAARAIPGPRGRWRKEQFAGFVGPGVSVEAASVCQAVCGVRVRRPWIDVDLWEFFLGLRAEQKFPNHLNKWLVRDMLRGLVPDLVLDRTDKTSFNEAHLAQIDYDVLRRYLIDPEHRIPGVDYALLAERLRGEGLGILDYNWARNLATAHAFLAQW